MVQSTTLPHLNKLRQDVYIQKQVKKRLKELADSVKTGNCKQKTLRGGPVEVIVPNRVKWPHEYVLSGSQKERISYDHLSVTQWMAGFCRILREEQNSKNQKFMLSISFHFWMMQMIFPGMRQRPAMLCSYVEEQGEVVSYEEIEKKLSH